jgi:hypothetical protein
MHVEFRRRIMDFGCAASPGRKRRRRRVCRPGKGRWARLRKCV